VNTGNWSIRLITDWDEIYSKSFQDKWLQYIEQAENSHIFFHPVLSNSWLTAYCKIWEIKPLFIIAESDGVTVFYPLIQISQNYKSFFRQIIAPLGFSGFDYADPLVIGNYNNYPGNLLYLISEELKPFKYDLLLLTGQHDIISSDLLKLTSKEKCYFTQLNKLDHGISTLLAQMSSKNRREHLRVERRLRELGSINFDIANKVDQSLEFEIQQFIKSYKARWPKAFFPEGFHESMIKEGINHNLLWFTQLKLNNKSIGWAIDFVWKRRCYAYMHTYKREYVSFAPGRTHLMERLNKALTSGVDVFDLLTGSETYKSEWFNQYKEIYSYQITSSRPISVIKNQLNKYKNKVLR
jgi:hypothetical protein